MGSGDYIATHSAVDGGEQTHTPVTLLLGEQPQYPLDSKLGGTRASLVAVEKIKKNS
jgi:hypothetical protein